MAYCTQTDLLEQISEDKLKQLTDDADTGSIDTSVVERAIENADSLIDSYCGVKFAVPFSTVPAIIRAISTDIAIYNLYSRGIGAPETIKERYDEMVDFLKDVAKGRATLGENDPDGVPSESNKPEISGSDRIFSRDKLKGW